MTGEKDGHKDTIGVLKVGDHVAVICIVQFPEAGPYPGMHIVTPVSEDTIEFVACYSAMIGKVKYDKDKGWIMQE